MVSLLSLLSNRIKFLLLFCSCGSGETDPSVDGSFQKSKGIFFISQKSKLKDQKMVMWVFGYGSLIWKTGFNFDERLVGFIKGYRRVFYQGSTDHRGTPEYPGRTVTLEPAEGEWGAAYKISNQEDKEVALTYLEVREKQYDQKAYVDFFTDPTATTPAVSGVMVYVASPDKKLNKNYLGLASLEDIAKQIVRARSFRTQQSLSLPT